jgi:hypothetical protein
VFQYIRRLCVTEEYIIIYSSVLRNIVVYIRWRYIPRLLRWLTEEYKLYSSVIELCSSVITEERILILRGI